jgi:hypothetical protein
VSEAKENAVRPNNVKTKFSVSVGQGDFEYVCTSQKFLPPEREKKNADASVSRRLVKEIAQFCKKFAIFWQKNRQICQKIARNVA